MAGSIGSVYYDVLPDVDVGRFNAAVSGSLAGAKPVKIKVDADTRTATAAAQKAAVQQSAIAQRSAAQLAAIQARAAAQSQLLSQRTTAQQAAAQARAVAATERGAARQAAAVERAAVREAAAAERATARGVAARQQAVSGIGRGLTLAGVGVAAVMGVAAVSTARFEKQVSAVAATGPDAAASIGKLRAEAIKYGADTAFSATEAAAGQEALIKANVSVTDTINGGLKGALDLAAAGSLGVAEAAEITATALSQYNLEGSQAGHVADLLAAGAGKAQGEVTDFAGALKYIGPVANGANISIENTTGAIAALANQGILGEQAGTSLRGMLLSLQAPSDKAAEAMARYGISAYDAQGNALDFAGIAGQLQDKLGGLDNATRDAAFGQIFGNAQITAARILYSEGAAGIDKWTSAVDDSGFATRTAQTKMNNLSGDVEKLGGAFESAFIKTAGSSTGPLRGLVQGVTGLVDAYSELPEAGQSAVFIGAGLAAAAALGTGGVIKLAGAVGSANDALKSLGVSWKTAGLAAGGIGIVLTAAAAVAGHFAVQQAQAAARTDELTTALSASKGAIDANIAATRARSLEDSGALKAAQALGISIEDVTQASLGNADAQARVNAVLKATGTEYAGLQGAAGYTSAAQKKLADDTKTVSDAVSNGSDELRNAQAAYERTKTATDAVATSTGTLTKESQASLGALLNVASAIDEVGAAGTLSAEGVKSLTDSLFESADAALAASDASIAYQQAIDDAAEAGKNAKDGLNDRNQAGRDNLKLLNQQANASQGYVSSLIAQGKSTKDVEGAMRGARSAFIDNARAMGATKGEAQALADKYGLIPKDVRTEISAQIAADQQKKLADLESSINALPDEQQTEIRALVKAGDFEGALKRIAELTRPLTAAVTPKVNNPAAAKAKAGLDYFGNPITKPVGVKTNGVPKAKADIGGIKGKGVTATVKSSGVPKVKADIGSVRGKGVVVTSKSAGVPKTKADINSVKGKGVLVTAKSAGVPATKASINSVQGKRVTVTATATGVSAVQAAINSIRGKTVTIFQKLVKGSAGGGVIEAPQRLAGGGVIRGEGGPTDDKVFGIDRATGRTSVMVSPTEFITNAMQYQRNRAAVETINAGGEWDLVPRRAAGGPVPTVGAGAGQVAQTTTAAHRSIVINIDLGPELGGIRRIVADEVAASGEYAATLTRMGR